MNSFGFIREACNVMGMKFKVDDSGFFDDLVEYDPTILDGTDKSVKALNRIAECWNYLSFFRLHVNFLDKNQRFLQGILSSHIHIY